MSNPKNPIVGQNPLANVGLNLVDQNANRSLQRLGNAVNAMGANQTVKQTSASDYLNSFELHNNNAQKHAQMQIMQSEDVLQEQAKREAEEGLTSYNHLNSDNRGVRALAGLANLGKFAGASVVNSGRKLIGNMYESDADALLDNVTDKKQQELLQRNSDNDKSLQLQARMAQIDNSIAQEKQKGLPNLQTIADLNEQRKQVEAQYDNGQKLSAEDIKALDAQLPKDKQITRSGNKLSTLRQIGNTAEEARGKAQEWAKDVDWGNHAEEHETELRLDRNELDKQVRYQNEAQKAKEQGDTAGNWANNLKALWTGAKNQAQAGASVANVSELLAQTAPYLVPYLGEGMMFGDATGVYADGKRKVREREDKLQTSAGENLAMAGIASAYAVADKLQQKVERGALKGFKTDTSVSKSIANKVNNGIDDVIASSSKLSNSMLVNGTASVAKAGNNALANVAFPIAKRIGMGAAGETVPEVFQQQVEDTWGGLSNQNANIDNLAKAAGSAALLGGVMATPSSVVRTGQDLYKAKSDEATAQHNKVTYGNEDVSNDDLINTKSAEYNPTFAVNRMERDANVDTAEGKQDLLSNVGKLQETVKDHLRQANDNVADIAKLDQYAKEVEEQKIKSERASAIAQQHREAGDIEKADKIDALIKSKMDTVQAKYDSVKSLSENADAVKQMQADTQEHANYIDQRVKELNSAYAEKSTETPKEETTEETNSPAYVQKLLDNPRVDDLPKIKKLLNDDKVSDEHKDSLRQLNDVLVALHSAKNNNQVSQEIKSGGNGYKGMSEYLEDSAKAKQLNDDTAQSNIDYAVNNLHDHLVEKHNAMLEAQELANAVGKTAQIQMKNGSWIVVPPKSKDLLGNKELRTNGGLAIHTTNNGKKGSRTVIDGVAQDIDVVAKTKDAIANLYKSPKAREKQLQDSFDDEVQKIINGTDNVNETVSTEPPHTEENNEGDLVDNSANTEEELLPIVDHSEAIDQPTETTTPEQHENVESEVEQSNVEQPKTLTESRNAIKADIQSSAKPNAQKHVAKEQAKVDMATQFIGEGSTNSTTQNIHRAWDNHGKANTGKYSSNDVVMLSANGNRNNKVRPVINGELQGEYKHIDKAIEAGASFVADTHEHLKGNNYNTGEQALARYLERKGYTRTTVGNGKVGMWTLSNENPHKATKATATDVASKEPVSVTTAHKAESIEQSVEGNTTVGGTSSKRVAPDTSTTTIEPNLKDKAKDVSPKGAIDAVDTKGETYKDSVTAEQSKPLLDQNLVKSGVVQRVREGLNSPLVSFKNLLTQFFAKEGSLENKAANLIRNTTDIKNPTPEQINHVTYFMQFAQDAVQSIVGNEKVKGIIQPSKYGYKNIAPFLLNSEGKLDENTAVAVSLASFNYLAKAPQSLTAEPTALGNMIGIPNAKSLDNATTNRLANMGVYREQMLQDLGVEAYRALQLKRLKNVSEVRQKRIEQALGAIAYGYLTREGLIEESYLTTAETKVLRNAELGTKDQILPTDMREKHIYTRPVFSTNSKDRTRTFPEIMEHASQLEAGSYGVLSKVFGYSQKVLPSTEPIKTVPQLFNDFGSKVSEFQKSVILKQQATPYSFNNKMHQVFTRLFKDDAVGTLDMLGGINTANVLDRNLLAAESINDGLMRSLTTLDEVADMNAQSLYFPLSVWVNNRSGIDSAFNPQGDIIHRSFVSMQAHHGKVDTSLDMFDESGKNTTEYGNWLKALGFTLADVEIPNTDGKDIDKVDHVNDYVKAMHDYINTKQVVDVARAYMRLEQGSPKANDARLVRELVTQWGTAGQSLKALQAIAYRQSALDMQAKSFDTYISSGSDGSNNGPAFTHTMLNTATVDMLRSVGLFEQGSGIKNLAEYRSQGFDDLYVQLSRQIADQWNNTNVDKGIKDAFNAIDSSFTERKGAKRVLVPFNYGSGLSSVLRANSRETLEGLYKRIEKAVNNPNIQVRDTELKTVLNAVNTIIKGQAKPVTLNQVNGLHAQLTVEQETALRNADEELRGDAVKEALGGMFANYITLNRSITGISNSAFNMFNAYYSKLLQEKIDEKYNANPDFKKVNEALTDAELQDVFKEVAKYIPSVQVAMGMESKNGRTSSIPLVKIGNTWNKDLEFTVPVQDVNPLPYSAKSTKGKNNQVDARPANKTGITNINTGIKQMKLMPPSVSGPALFIQSHDAYVTFKTMQKHNVENEHDSNSTNPNDLIAVAKTQNKAFLEAVTKSHMGISFLEAWASPMQLITEGKLDTNSEEVRGLIKDIHGQLKKSLGYTAKENPTFKALVDQFHGNLRNADLEKLNTLVNIEHINQYATEGGEHKVTDAERALILQEKKNLTNRYNVLGAQLDQIASKLDTVNSTKPTAKPANKLGNIRPNTKVVEETKPTTKDFYNPTDLDDRTDIDSNELGKALQQDKARITNQGELAKYVLDFADSKLKSNMSSASKNKLNAQMTAFKPLLNAFISSKLSNTKVNVITQRELLENPTKYEGGVNALKGGMFAWHNDQTGVVTIVTDMANKAIHPEVVAHELLHTITVSAYKNAKASDKGKLFDATKDIDKILSKVHVFMGTKEFKNLPENHPLVSALKYAGTSPLELITMGLTNLSVMQFLQGHSVKASEVRNTPNNRSFGNVTLYTDFIKGVLNLAKSWLGMKDSANKNEINSLKLLSHNVGLLMQQGNHTPNNGVNQGAFNANEQVRNFNAKEVYSSLDKGNITPEFDSHLSKVMQNITPRMYSLNARDNYTPNKVWDSALQQNKAPYMTKAISNGFKLSDREQFAVEAVEHSMQALLKGKSAHNEYGVLTRMFNDAKKNVTVADMHEGNFAKATAEEKQIAQAKYDYVFNNGKGQYLGRFVALALGSQEFKNVLDSFIPATKFKSKYGDKNDLSYFDRLMQYADHGMALIENHSTRTDSLKTIGSQVAVASNNLLQTDLKARNKLYSYLEDKYQQAQDIANSIAVKSAEKIEGVIDKSVPDIKYVKTAKDLIHQAVNGKTFAVFDSALQLRNLDRPNTTLGTASEFLNELTESSTGKQLAERMLMLTKNNETEAERLRTSIASEVKSHFKNKGKDLTVEQSTAITYAVLRTDLQALTAHNNMAEIHRMVGNSAYLNDRISAMRNLVGNNLHSSRAMLLGYYMATGKPSLGLAMNSYAIATNAGLKEVPNASADEQTMANIDALASMYALKFTSAKHKNELNKLFESEKSGNSYGGITTTVKFHKALVEASKEYSFKDDPLNFMKGFTPEITNPNKQIEIAHTEQEAQRLRDSYYEEVGNLNVDSLDPTGHSPKLFYTEDAKSHTYVSGAIALGSQNSKGQRLGLDNQGIAPLERETIKLLNSMGENFNPFTDLKSNLRPYLNSDGKVVDYGYQLSHFNRDTHLERNNDFATLLGTAHSVGARKIANEDQNQKIVDAMFDHYHGSNKANRSGFVHVSYDSTDPKARAAWDRLPNETKHYVQEVWGDYGMWVPNDSFLTLFGAPKLSVSNMFNKRMQDRNVGEAVFIAMAESVFGNKARIRTSQIERGWQEMVQLSKNMAVIRNFTTMFANTMGNVMLLSAHGIPLSQILKDTHDSIKGGMQYRKDITLYEQLRERLYAGVGNANEIKTQMDMLENRLANNPVKDFIDMGMLAGIVEDTEGSTNSFSYASGLRKKFDKQYNSLPNLVRKGVETAFVTPSTPLYQFLHSGAQYSDFSAKYTMYKFYKAKGKSHESALQMAQDNFINYDVPTSQVLQYANDMGILMFTKYNIRIQKALFALLAKRPASALAQFALMNGSHMMPPAIDPIVFNEYGNPIKSGAFSLFKNLDQPLPLKMLF